MKHMWTDYHPMYTLNIGLCEYNLCKISWTSWANVIIMYLIDMLACEYTIVYLFVCVCTVHMWILWLKSCKAYWLVLTQLLHLKYVGIIPSDELFLIIISDKLNLINIETRNMISVIYLYGNTCITSFLHCVV